MRSIFALLLFVAVLVQAGCTDDVRKTKKITVYEEEPVRMVSPGQEVVE